MNLKYPVFIVYDSDGPFGDVEEFLPPYANPGVKTVSTAVHCDESAILHRRNDLCCCKS